MDCGLLGSSVPRQEYWSGLAFPSPGESSRARVQTDVSSLVGVLITTEPPRKPNVSIINYNKQSVLRKSTGQYTDEFLFYSNFD